MDMRSLFPGDGCIDNGCTNMTGFVTGHSCSQGVHWVHVHPQGGEENRGVIYRGKV